MFKMLSKLRPVLAAAAVGLAVHAAPAAADAFNAGSLSSSTPYIQFVTSHNSFIDLFSFNLAVESDIAASLSSLNLNVGPHSIFNIDNVHLRLFSLAAPQTLLMDGTSTLSFDSLNPGNYFITVSGKAGGIFGGGYLFGLAAMPVPEPEQWMMLGAGLLLMVGAARRRLG